MNITRGTREECLPLKVTETFTYPERKEAELTLLPTSLSQALQTGYPTVSPRRCYTDFTNKEIETKRAQSAKKKKKELVIKSGFIPLAV